MAQLQQQIDALQTQVYLMRLTADLRR